MRTTSKIASLCFVLTTALGGSPSALAEVPSTGKEARARPNAASGAGELHLTFEPIMDTSVLSLTGLVVAGDGASALELSFSFASTGREMARPDSVRLRLFSTLADTRLTGDSRLALTIDGKPLDMGPVRSQLLAPGSRSFEADVSLSAFLRLASASRIAGELGPARFELTAPQLAALRTFRDRIPTATAGL